MERNYTIIICATAQQLITEVNKCIKDGWIPSGGATTLLTTQGTRWHQTMIIQR